MLTQEDRVKLLGFRVRHDINQLHFSRGIISRNQLSNIENGKSSTTEKVLYQLYLRFCEYMIVLDDYNRFHFDSLKNYGPYKQLQAALDLYDLVCEEAPQAEMINQINLQLNKGHFGLINTLVMERIGDLFISRQDEENAFTFYLKGYYQMTVQVDEINSAYITSFLTKIGQLGLKLGKTFNVIEILDYLDHIKRSVEGVDTNRDYLYTLAMSYHQLGMEEKALKICKEIELIHFNDEDMSKVEIAKTFQLMGSMYYASGADALGQKYGEKAIKLYKLQGNQEAIAHIEAEISKHTA